MRVLMSNRSDFTSYKVSFDGKLIDFTDANVHIASSSVLYGLSVYSVFPVSVTKEGLAIFRLKEHFKRLVDSAHIIGIDSFIQEWDFNRFNKAVQELVVENSISNDIFVRATVHVTELVSGTRSRGLQTKLSMFIYSSQSILPANGARLKTTHWRRVPDISIPARAKVNGAYVNSVLGKQDAIDSGYDDCIFLDNSGHVCELSAANIFCVRNGVLITPSTTSDILEGINRRAVIEYAKGLNIEVQERSVDLTELYIADEVFACGTSAYLTPVIEIDGRIIADGNCGPITEKLSKIHDDTLHGRINSSKKYLTYISK